MKKNKNGHLNLKKTNNNTATSTNVEKNPTPKPTKQEKEAAKKAHAEELIAKKAETKAANVKKNNEAQAKNQNNGMPLTRRAKESYVHFLRRKRRAKKREALLAKQQNATPVEKKYSLLINYNRDMKETVLKEMEANKLKLNISTDSYSYVKVLTKEELDSYLKILNTQSIKDKYLELYIKKWEKNHPGIPGKDHWDEKRNAAIRKERARIETMKTPLSFQATKVGVIISSNNPKKEKKPTNNTREARIAAHEARKSRNKKRVVKWKVDAAKRAENGTTRRLRIKLHNTPHKHNKRTTAPKTSENKASTKQAA